MMEIYDYDRLFERVFALLKKELSSDDFELMQKYDQTMVISSLGKATRLKNLKILLSLSRLLKKDWKSETRARFIFVLKRFVIFAKQGIIVEKRNDQDYNPEVTWLHPKNTG